MEVLKEEKETRWSTRILLILNLIIWAIILFMIILWNGVVNAASINMTNWQLRECGGSNCYWRDKLSGETYTAVYPVDLLNSGWGSLNGTMNGTLNLTIDNTNINDTRDIRPLVYVGSSANQNASITKECTVTNGTSFGKKIQCRITFQVVSYSNQTISMPIWLDTNANPLSKVTITGFGETSSTGPATNIDIQQQTIDIINNITNNFQQALENNNSQYNALIQELYNNNASQIAQLEAVYTAITPDTTDFDNFEDVEDELKTYTNVNLNSFNVDLDTDTNNWVWTTLTNLVQSNTLVFGMIISILSIGLIKLIMNR